MHASIYDKACYEGGNVLYYSMNAKGSPKIISLERYFCTVKRFLLKRSCPDRRTTQKDVDCRSILEIADEWNPAFVSSFVIYQEGRLV